MLRNTWHYVIIRRRKFWFPKFVLRCSYEAALRKGVTTALVWPTRKTIFAKLNGTWIARGSYGVYVAVTGSMWLLRGLCPGGFFSRENRLEYSSYSMYMIYFRDGVTVPYPSVEIRIEIMCWHFNAMHSSCVFFFSAMAKILILVS